MAAASIAAGHGIEIAATTRKRRKADALTAVGVDHVLLDDGESLAASVRAIWPEGPDHVLELVGASTVVDSLHLVRRGGTVCVAGSLSGWAVREFEPIAAIPSGTKLTAFHSDNVNDVVAFHVGRWAAGGHGADGLLGCTHGANSCIESLGRRDRPCRRVRRNQRHRLRPAAAGEAGLGCGGQWKRDRSMASAMARWPAMFG
jgi:hypothetical protein